MACAPSSLILAKHFAPLNKALALISLIDQSNPMDYY